MPGFHDGSSPDFSRLATGTSAARISSVAATTQSRACRTKGEATSYEPYEAERTVSQRMKDVERVMGKDFAGDLSSTHCDELTEYADRAVHNHGRLAVIGGTTYAIPGSRSSRGRNDSPLVRLLDGASEMSA